MGNICCSIEQKNNYTEEERPKNTYMFYNAMDDNNKKAMDVFQNDGMDAAIKHMTTNSDGNQRSYSEIRRLYG